MNKTNIHPLNTIDGETLMSIPMEPLNFVVDSLISGPAHSCRRTEGGKILAGFWLATTIAKGEPSGISRQSKAPRSISALKIPPIASEPLFSITDEVRQCSDSARESNILEGKVPLNSSSQFLKVSERC